MSITAIFGYYWSQCEYDVHERGMSMELVIMVVFYSSALVFSVVLLDRQRNTIKSQKQLIEAQKYEIYRLNNVISTYEGLAKF